MQFPSRSTFRNALAPLTKAAAENLGSRVTVKRAAITYRPDNSPIPGWSDVATNVAMRLSTVTEQRLQNIWGIDSSVTSEGSCTDANDIQSGDVIIVTSGDFTGEIFQVLDVRPSPLSGALAVGLTTSTEDVAA